MSPLRMACLSLTRHMFASAMSVVAIALSVACAGMLLRLYNVSASRFSAMGAGADAIVGAKAGGIEILLGSLNGEGEFPGFLPYKLFESLKSDRSVQHGDGVVTQPNYIETIVPFVYFGKYHDDRVVGTDESFLTEKYARGLFTVEGRWFRSPKEVVLGSAIARDSNFRIGDVVQIHPWLGGEVLPEQIPFRVSGILKPTETQWDRTLFSSVTDAQDVFRNHLPALAGQSIWGAEVLNYFLIDLKPGGFQSLEKLVNQRTVGQVIRVDQVKERLQEISGSGQVLGMLVMSFVLLLGGLSVCSMLVTRFEGMSLQIAVLRALGYTKGHLSSWLIWEGALLGIAGILVGAGIDAIGLPVLRGLLGSALPSPEVVPSSILVSAPIWAVAFVAILLSTLIPLFKMFLKDTHASLMGL